MLAIFPTAYLGNHLLRLNSPRKAPFKKCSLPSLEKAFRCENLKSLEFYYHDHGILIFREFYQTQLQAPESCIEQAGFTTSPLLYATDSENHTWITFQARKPKNRLTIRSIIKSPDHTQSWPTFEAWQTDSTISNTPFLAITELQPMR